MFPDFFSINYYYLWHVMTSVAHSMSKVEIYFVPLTMFAESYMKYKFIDY